ncbi:MAG: MBOAT family protein [Anaerolineae bacterium]|nr:MBOAT family protein [Anaerolineae bacterium]
MSFNSPTFLFFFLPVFFLVYSVASGRARIFIGIVGSLLFYSSNHVEDLPILLGLLFATYSLSVGISRWNGRIFAVLLLLGGILANVALIIFYKLLLNNSYPFGLSYLSFQSIATLVESKKYPSGQKEDILSFAFYFLLFPKIAVGPITRYSQVRDQINSLKPDLEIMVDGFRRFIRGLAKKVLIADTLSIVVTPIFLLSSPDISMFHAWLVLFSYALQLYFDFSGYVDMAIGLALLMGIKLPENFDFPYISKSISEFWRRWHITLSSWFRDFVFYPLERKRLMWVGQPLNILIVFALTGLWHGLTLNFFIWGLIHGLALIFEGTLLGKKMKMLWAPLQHLYALIIIFVSWVFFRSPTIEFAFSYLQRLVGIPGESILGYDAIAPLPIIEPTFLIAFSAGLVLSFPIKKTITMLTSKYGLNNSWLFQVVYDVFMVALLAISIAAISARSFVPGIYGSF